MHPAPNMVQKEVCDRAGLIKGAFMGCERISVRLGRKLFLIHSKARRHLGKADYQICFYEKLCRELPLLIANAWNCPACMNVFWKSEKELLLCSNDFSSLQTLADCCPALFLKFLEIKSVWACCARSREDFISMDMERESTASTLEKKTL